MLIGHLFITNVSIVEKCSRNLVSWSDTIVSIQVISKLVKIQYVKTYPKRCKLLLRLLLLWMHKTKIFFCIFDFNTDIVLLKLLLKIFGKLFLILECTKRYLSYPPLSRKCYNVGICFRQKKILFSFQKALFYFLL